MRALRSAKNHALSKRWGFARASAPFRSLSRLQAVIALIAFVLVLTAASDARAGDFDVNDPNWNGCSELLEIARAELGAGRVEAVGVLDWDQVAPEDGVLAIHPVSPMDAEETTSFMKAGGRLAIVDDYGRGAETLQRFRIDRIAAPSRPVEALRNRAVFAIAEPVIDVVAGHSIGPHPVVAQVQRLVTNHPTGLRHPNLSPVLRIRAIGEPDVIVAVAGQVGKGRLFAMSDPSALINQMLRYPGNRAFVAGLARYLVDDDGLQRRRGRLWIVANKFDEEGAFGGETTLGKDIASQLRGLLSALEEARQSGLPDWLLITFAALAGIGLATWVARASARPYKSPMPRYARGAPLVSQGGVAGRFALLAAPSSPPSLALLELKSALFESVGLRFNLSSEPTTDALAQLIQSQGALDEGELTRLREVLATMQRVEASVVAGKPAVVSRPTLTRAAEVVRRALQACEACGAAPHGEAAASIEGSGAKGASLPGGPGLPTKGAREAEPSAPNRPQV